MTTLDTTKLSNAQHQLKAIAFNTAGNSAQSTVTITVNNAVSSSSIYINVGGGAITDSCTGVNWQADQYYTNGQTNVNSTLPCCLGVYTTERTGSFSYNIPVSNGQKFVILKFAEIDFMTTGARVFNVSINGTAVVTNLDIYKSVGFGKPLDLSFPVNVTNNAINVTFVPVVSNPTLNGIEVLVE